MTAFSATSIKIITRDSIIPIPKPVAKEIVKDLIKKDLLEAELNVCKVNYDLLNNNLQLKDSIILSKNNMISLYEQKEKNYLTIIELKDLQQINLQNNIKKLNKDIKKLKLKLVATKLTTAAFIILFGYIIIN